MMKNKPRHLKQPKDLSDFIKENITLITSLGVFTALTGFANNLAIKEIGIFISFGFLTITVLIWLQLWAKFPPDGKYLLRVFESTLALTVFMVVIYWLIYYRDIWNSVLFLPITTIISFILSYPIRKSNVVDKILRSHPILGNFLRYIIAILIIGISLVISILIAEKVNSILNEAIKEFR